MTKHRKGLLVVDNDDEIIGIITPKDVLMRVVAQGKSPDVTRGVFSVMTPNPDSVPADLTIWDALKKIHDQRFLHLPVKEDDGRVIELVDVMDLAADGEGGKGWRDFFKGAIEARGDGSDTASDRSDSVA